MLPGGAAPVFFGHFSEDGVLFAHDRGFAEAVEQAKQGRFFFFKIFLSARGDKRRVGGQPLFPGTAIPEFTFKEGADQAEEEAALGLLCSEGNPDGKLQVCQHLGHIHLSPYRCGSGTQCIDPVNDILFNSGVKKIFDLHNIV